MKRITYNITFLVVLSLFFISCTLPDDDPVTCEEIFEELQQQKIAIEDYAATSICGEDYECQFIGFGSKPCGGPWEYLIYTTSIDTEQLIIMVNDYNELENNYNELCGGASDCSIPSQPIGFTCEDNQCIPIFLNFKNLVIYLFLY
ncbi:hypothetical protein [Winogradskyella endarachnes]|uniref:DUF4377 domain-containing protein n=1 Tax=Winogradskyella endarachnes TaxID=2681965 RepID=A0A6L6U9H4_9FLAO|nr:hypothetical protein [Winogradskyella endarachnes]MUU78971.1 hypothetical protein [Winogradskyella endarachnes]